MFARQIPLRIGGSYLDRKAGLWEVNEMYVLDRGRY